jgi:hypothetical protein
MQFLVQDGGVDTASVNRQNSGRAVGFRRHTGQPLRAVLAALLKENVMLRFVVLVHGQCCGLASGALLDRGNWRNVEEMSNKCFAISP